MEPSDVFESSERLLQRLVHIIILEIRQTSAADQVGNGLGGAAVLFILLLALLGQYGVIGLLLGALLIGQRVLQGVAGPGAGLDGQLFILGDSV